MAKIQIKSEKITPFGGIFPIMECFDRLLGQTAVSLHPTLRTCSSDTRQRAIEELTEDNITYVSDEGKSYDFNAAEKLNGLLLNALLSTGQLKEGMEYDFDFDHQFIETEKYDAKMTYKHFFGYHMMNA